MAQPPNHYNPGNATGDQCCIEIKFESRFVENPEEKRYGKKVSPFGYIPRGERNDIQKTREEKDPYRPKANSYRIWNRHFNRMKAEREIPLASGV